MTQQVLLVLGPISGLLGTIAGIAGLFLSIRTHLRDNSKVAISASAWHHELSKAGSKPTGGRSKTISRGAVVEIEIINRGRRIVRISTIGIHTTLGREQSPQESPLRAVKSEDFALGQSKDGKHQSTIDLLEGEKHTEVIDVDRMKGFCRINDSSRAYAEDTLGRRHETIIENLKIAKTYLNKLESKRARQAVSQKHASEGAIIQRKTTVILSGRE
jgi:hypothetical protein